METLSYIYIYFFFFCKEVKVKVAPWKSPGQNTGVLFPFPWDLPNPGIEPRSPALQAPKNNWSGCQSLLQRIFPTSDLQFKNYLKIKS